MENLTINEVNFLVALLASEEAETNELESEFQKWNTDSKTVQSALVGLISDGTIIVRSIKNGVFNGFEQSESLQLLKDWNQFIHSAYQICFSDNGWERWDSDDWGISTKRAKYLVFYNPKSQ